MNKPAHHNIGDTISEFAAALTKTGSCPELPGKLVAFSKSPNLSCGAVGLKVVADLVEVADSSSSIFKTYLANFVQALFSLARASEDKDGVRQMAVEVLLHIVEDEDLQLYLNIPEFASDFVRILLELMLNVEDDGDCIDQDFTAMDFADTIRNDAISKEGLDRVVSEIGEENVKNIIFSYVLEYLKKDEWRYKLVALMAISETVVEFLPEEGIDTLLDEIMELLKVQLNNQHHRVRLAACQAIGQIALKFYQYLVRKSYTKVILSLLVNMFDDLSPRVRCFAVVAVHVITEERATDVMPFANQFMDKCLERIKPENPRELREQSIDGIGVLAIVIQKKFMKYYSIVIPVMKEIIIASSTKEERAMRGKAVACISTISESVGDEMVQSDVHEVLQAVLQISGAGLENDDPFKKYSQGKFYQMCRILKGEFVPYLPQLIPNFLRVLNVEPQRLNHEENDAKVVTIVADGKWAELKKSEIREIFGVVQSLKTFIKVLGTQFGEYLGPSAQSLLSLISFPLCDNVKLKALTAMAALFTVASESSNRKIRLMLTVWVDAVLEKVFKDLIIPRDNESGITDSELIIARKKTNGLSKCLRNAGPDVMDAYRVKAICEKIFRLLKESNQRRAITVTRKYDREQSLRLGLFELLKVIMSFHADLYLQASAEFIETHLDPNCSPSDRALALYVFGNVLEHLEDESAPLWPTFASRLVECIGDPNPGVRGAAAHGVIQAAKCSQFPDELIQKAAAQLFALISAKQSQKKGFLYATEKMIAALGTIVVHRNSCCLQPSPEQFLNLWINNLPLKVDTVEGRRTHGDLVDLLVQNNLEVLGPQNANLPKLAAICASIYRSDFAMFQTNEEIRDFMQKVGFGVISSVGANFDEKLQKSIKRIQQDSQA